MNETYSEKKERGSYPFFNISPENIAFCCGCRIQCKDLALATKWMQNNCNKAGNHIVTEHDPESFRLREMQMLTESGEYDY